MKAAVMSTPILQRKILELADKRIALEVKEGLLNKDDKMFHAKVSHRRTSIEQSLQEVAEQLTDNMICKMESKTFIRGAYYMCSELLTRAYHQGMLILVRVPYMQCSPRQILCSSLLIGNMKPLDISYFN